MKRVQDEYSKEMKKEDDKAKLQLEKNVSGNLTCTGRIQGNHPAQRLSNIESAANLVMNAHLKTLHGGEASLRQIARNYAQNVSFHKISTPGNLVKLRYFTQ